MSRRPKLPAPTVDPETGEIIEPEPLLEHIPAILRRDGRVAGFEQLRDDLLTKWEKFVQAGVNPYSTLKLVLETDRHAMFAEVQADKRKGDLDSARWKEYQDYLHGRIDVAPMADSAADAPVDSNVRPMYSPHNDLLEVRDDLEMETEEALALDAEETTNG